MTAGTPLLTRCAERRSVSAMLSSSMRHIRSLAAAGHAKDDNATATDTGSLRLGKKACQQWPQHYNSDPVPLYIPFHLHAGTTPPSATPATALTARSGPQDSLGVAEQCHLSMQLAHWQVPGASLPLCMRHHGAHHRHEGTFSDHRFARPHGGQLGAAHTQTGGWQLCGSQSNCHHNGGCSMGSGTRLRCSLYRDLNDRLRGCSYSEGCRHSQDLHGGERVPSHQAGSHGDAPLSCSSCPGDCCHHRGTAAGSPRAAPFAHGIRGGVQEAPLSTVHAHCSEGGQLLSLQAAECATGSSGGCDCKDRGAPMATHDGYRTRVLLDPEAHIHHDTFIDPNMLIDTDDDKSLRCSVGDQAVVSALGDLLKSKKDMLQAMPPAQRKQMYAQLHRALASTQRKRERAEQVVVPVHRIPVKRNATDLKQRRHGRAGRGSSGGSGSGRRSLSSTRLSAAVVATAAPAAAFSLATVAVTSAVTAAAGAATAAATEPATAAAATAAAAASSTATPAAVKGVLRFHVQSEPDHQAVPSWPPRPPAAVPWKPQGADHPLAAAAPCSLDAGSATRRIAGKWPNGMVVAIPQARRVGQQVLAVEEVQALVRAMDMGSTAHKAIAVGKPANDCIHGPSSLQNEILCVRGGMGGALLRSAEILELQSGDGTSNRVKLFGVEMAVDQQC